MNCSVKDCMLQYEGSQTSRPVWICRCPGFNLWSGRDQDRCRIVCHTDFVEFDWSCGNKSVSAYAACSAVENHLGNHCFVVWNGGERLLQQDHVQVDALPCHKFENAVMNWTLQVPQDLDWVCDVPKAHAELNVDELKIVYQPKEAGPDMPRALGFQHSHLQPVDGPSLKSNTQLGLHNHPSIPHWKLGLQTQKLGIP
jgi:7-carboxy-7-deazaguanine synthase